MEINRAYRWLPVSPAEINYPTRRSIRLAREVESNSVEPGIVSSSAPAPVDPVPAAPVATVRPPFPTRRATREAMAATADMAAHEAHGDGQVVEVVIEQQPVHAGTIDASIETDGEGFAAVPVGSRLDWLAPAQAETKDEPDVAAAARPPVPAWLSSVRATVAGVDLRSPDARRRLPQIGVVVVMAAATMGNAYAGHFTPAASSIGGPSAEFARAQVAILPGSDGGTAVTSDLDNSGDLVAGEDGVLRVRAAEDASRGGARDPLPGCDGVPPEVLTTNGNVAEEYLCVLPNSSHMLRADAAEAFALMDEAYVANFGTAMCVTSGYRSYAQQAALRRQKPGLAAPAGSSEHGNGLAVDLCGGVQDEGAGYWWLRENGPAFGFDNPPWARRGGSKYEPWHWEYVAGQW